MKDRMAAKAQKENAEPASSELTKSETPNLSPSPQKPEPSGESSINANYMRGLTSVNKMHSLDSIKPPQTSRPPSKAAISQEMVSSETSNAEGSGASPEITLEENNLLYLSLDSKTPTVSSSRKLPHLKNAENHPDFKTSGVSHLVESGEGHTPAALQPANKPKTASPVSSSTGDLPITDIPVIPYVDSLAGSAAVAPGYPISGFAAATPATALLALNNPNSYFPFSSSGYSQPANGVSSNHPLIMMLLPPSPNKAKFGLPVSSQFLCLPAGRFSPDVIALCSEVKDTTQGAVPAGWLVNYGRALQQLTLDEFCKVAAIQTANAAADAVDTTVDAPVLAIVGPEAPPVISSANTIASAAPYSLSPNTVVFGGVPVQAWAPSTASPANQIARTINFGGFPVGTTLQQVAAPLNVAHNTFDFGGVPVRPTAQPITPPLSVTSNTINFGGWPAMPQTAALMSGQPGTFSFAGVPIRAPGAACC